MRVGTKSLLFGYHQFLLHPLCVALGWWKLFGFPWDPRLWVAFLVHDWGYWGKPNMDGLEGELHPHLGAIIMGALFDRLDMHWYFFTLYHSRFLAKRHGMKPSRLCLADKYVALLLPWWIQLPLMNLTGEIHEYMLGQNGRTFGQSSQREWFERMRKVLVEFVETNKASYQ